MFNAKKYLDKVSQTPNEYYRSLNQASVDCIFDNTTQLYTIKEQSALPFSNVYNDVDVWLSSVSDDLVNISKVYSDFVEIFFKDCNHKQNYKGQYYKINIDSENEEYYICYDRINKLDQVLTTKVVRCNNVLTWRDKFGNVVTMPCYLGTDITSTNNQVSKDATIPNSRMIILIQANEYTMNIRNNQRFMFQNSSCFKVEETNNYMQEQGTDGQVTCVKIYISYSDLLPNDNTELNICDYYDNHFTLSLDQSVVEQKNGFNGKLNAIVKDGNNNIVDMPLQWDTSDNAVVTVDNLGNYHIVGNNGDTAKITCYMSDNSNVFSTVTIKVVNDYLPDNEIIVTPNDIKSIRQGYSQEFKCGVYINGEKQSIKVYCHGIDANQNNYSIEETIEGYKVTNIKTTPTPLTLVFNASGCDDVEIKLSLKGVI